MPCNLTVRRLYIALSKPSEPKRERVLSDSIRGLDQTELVWLSSVGLGKLGLALKHRHMNCQSPLSLSWSVSRVLLSLPYIPSVCHLMSSATLTSAVSMEMWEWCHTRSLIINMSGERSCSRGAVQVYCWVSNIPQVLLMQSACSSLTQTPTIWPKETSTMF